MNPQVVIADANHNCNNIPSNSMSPIVPTSTLLEDAEVALEKLAHHEVQLIKETEELFKRQVEHMEMIDRLKGSIPNIGKVDLETKRLSSLVESSSTLVEEVCSKFRSIDMAKARVDDCLTKVSDILDLETCRNGVVRAMDSKNFEEAAMHIKRFLSINQEELRKTIHVVSSDVEYESSSEAQTNDSEKGIDLESTEQALTELGETRAKLFSLCKDHLTQAIKEESTKDIERFFKIFPMLNEHQEGLRIYSEYLGGKIKMPTLIDDVNSSSKANRQNIHADKLAALYENIAKLIDSHQPLIETYYGPGHLIVVVKVIQKICDLLSRKVLVEFRNETNLQSVVKIVKGSSLQSASQSSANTALNLNLSRLDPRNVDNILNQISLIVSRSEVYLSFVVDRIQDDFNAQTDDENKRKYCLQELYNLIFIECELNHLVQEVGGIYVMLEQFYLNESAKKAIVMDQVDIEGTSCFISSMLDDTFFIVKKCTKRAISTKSTEVFCAIINHCTTLLESTFCRVLEERLRNQQYYSTVFTTKNLDLSQAYSAIQSGRYLQSNRELELAKAQYFSALNNLDKACNYIQTLRGILDSDIKKLRPALLVASKLQDNQIEKSVTCLNELSQLVNRFTSIVNSSLYQLFNALFRNRLKNELKTIVAENPDIIAVVSKSPDEVTSLARDLLLNLDKSTQDSLTDENQTKLINITKDFLASSLTTIKKTN